MERSVMSLSVLVLACLVGSGAAQSRQKVSAHWIEFLAKEMDWDMNKAHDVACKKYDADKPYEWRSKYYWTNIGDLGDLEQSCGKCIHVTNTANGNEITVRIVGTTGQGLELDKPAFDQLDSDGQSHGGNLVVNYKFVDCDPTPAGPGESNVKADFSNYNPEENKWAYPSHAECAAKDGDKPLEWRKRYGWTAYCGKYYKASNPEENCGKCLKVTNTDTKDSVTVRIMDTCAEKRKPWC
ncbi:Pathoproteinsis-related protein PR-4 [Hibiscus syriacus]|uniref:Pathoproteinsis-related protein PR-4 n=1 Tax=Hibiscus syriacus TaxID=106335 RepID=A0A6A3C2X8_HIBSY|nr:pathogenesis-related protein P2-like [Hibiscus syriacus]KAE8721449.1 Pathoproteinsis-related protein PR-4 [Hibiscus syriacus]